MTVLIKDSWMGKIVSEHVCLRQRREGEKGRGRETPKKGEKEEEMKEEGRAEMKTGKEANTRTKNDITHLPGCFSRRQNAKPTSTPLISQPGMPI